ncbi:copper chaperone PCu(A)C [Aureimonas psammosilenae]|uniref:copper chaperone PCu(A)C n=1 Tax=Aureimonas psammosilenae TaxID=2495496 RepID=UPI00186A7027|nr:copper chaperone PCu(A)C [Aureimonas psammosilenae]
MRHAARLGTATAAILAATLLAPAGAGAEGNPLAAMGTAFQPVVRGAIRVEDGSAKPVAAGTSAGQAYLTITNRGPEPDRITALSSPSSRETRLYRKGPDGTLAPAGDLTLAPGQTLRMSPDDVFVDFRNVLQPFRAGGEVSLTVTFEKAGAIGLRLPVR